MCIFFVLPLGVINDDDVDRLPRDFLDFATRRSTEQHIDRRASELSASPPDARNAAQSPQIIVSSPSTVDDDDDDVASTVQPGRSLGSVDGRGSRHVDRLKVRAAAAAVRRQRRSNYDNVEDEVGEDLNDDEDGGQPSRRTTVSSVRTEYSPPWDADRWRFLVDSAGRVYQDDGRRSRESCDGEVRRTGTLERPEQVCQSVSHNLYSSEILKVIRA